MSKRPDPRDDAVAKAEQDLTRLNGQVESMRAVLVRLLQDVVQAEKLLDGSQATRLLEANEQLVLTALEAQIDADTVADALEESTRVAGLDPLTGLPNRTLLLDRLAQAIAHAKRYGHRLALLFLDLNNFKQVNDTFGHAVGDRAIQLVADCMVSLVRETDTVSRHGGDEFLILLADITHAADAAAIAEKLNASLGSYSRIDDHQVRLSASIGISIYPEDGEDARSLIDRADAAMYVAKRHEMGGFVFHSDPPAGQPRPGAPLVEPQQRRLTQDQLAIAEYERRHAQLREANEQLVLAALGAQELQAAAEHARQRQTELLTLMAQELSNPFAPIRVAAAMLGRQDADQALLPRARAIIEQQVDQMSQLVDGLLGTAPQDAGRLALGHRRFDLAATVATVVQACRPAMDRRQQVLAVEIAAAPLEVRGDPDLIAQVLTNLLGNATSYSHDGGRIRLSVAVAGHEVVMTVSDVGAGIAPEAMAAIFDPFVRDPRASAVNQEGLGIGLTVVRAIVEAHGGRVVAASAGIGHGSEFVVTLPMAGLPAAPIAGIAGA
ncbi:MAG: diguanylate cyclase domain-containing protein [Burkholderiaceae bacterium]